MSVPDRLPRIWASKRRVYIEWGQWPDSAPTVVINLGQYREEVLGWPSAVSREAVEFVEFVPVEVDGNGCDCPEDD